MGYQEADGLVIVHNHLLACIFWFCLSEQHLLGDYSRSGGALHPTRCDCFFHEGRCEILLRALERKRIESMKDFLHAPCFLVGEGTGTKGTLHAPDLP